MNALEMLNGIDRHNALAKLRSLVDAIERGELIVRDVTVSERPDLMHCRQVEIALTRGGF